LAREMAALETHSKRILRSSSKQAYVTVKHASGEEEIHMVNFADLNIPEPRTFKEAMSSKESKQWTESMKSEVINFLSRRS